MLVFVFFPFFFSMSFLIFLGSLVSISSSSWFGVWGGLELNMLCFLPILIHFSSFMGVESVVKYFLIQSFGSVGVLLGGLFQDSFFFSSLSFLFFIFFFSLFLKVGVFPFHWWVPGVFSGSSWFGVFLLSTWQKVAPVFIFSSFFSSGFIFLMFSCFSSLVGGISGVGQTSVRAILAFSSVSHAGWFFCLFCVSSLYGFVYFFIYLFSSAVMILFLWVLDYCRVSQVFFSSFFVCFVFFICLMTVSGFPPFFGFFSKLLAFMVLNSSLLSFLCLCVLIVGSLFSLYFYIGLFFSCFFFLFSAFSFSFATKKIFLSIFCVSLVSFFSLFFLDYFFLFFSVI
uniref:NADH-ubiquinone oxidoreductase chain 2 n=1 Tax=Emplectonema gracile TaxID=6230 RepID=H6BCG5_9BILA|nr:NADH dehydrogenase subunit 2 [Emplectonema gracile]AEC12105.1 NADH dehydrogenase subunit 2 [Emplectonema gracile]